MTNQHETVTTHDTDNLGLATTKKKEVTFREMYEWADVIRYYTFINICNISNMMNQKISNQSE